jgi:hypothetical protein
MLRRTFKPEIGRVIFYRDGEKWLAQAIERDICVQADTLDDLYGRFEVAVRLECDEKGSLDHIPAAPVHFERMWQWSIR